MSKLQFSVISREKCLTCRESLEFSVTCTDTYCIVSLTFNMGFKGINHKWYCILCKWHSFLMVPEVGHIGKSWPKFSQTFYMNYLGIFKWVAHFLVDIQGLWCVKTYLPKTGVAFYLFPQDFPFPCLLVAQNVSLALKKWQVAPNSAFCGESWTLSYLSMVQLGTQDGKQRHRTQNIDGMDFPTWVRPFCVVASSSPRMVLEVTQMICMPAAGGWYGIVRNSPWGWLVWTAVSNLWCLSVRMSGSGGQGWGSILNKTGRNVVGWCSHISWSDPFVVLWSSPRTREVWLGVVGSTNQSKCC